MAVHSEGPFDGYVLRCLLRPRAISAAPKVVLIINIIIPVVDVRRW